MTDHPLRDLALSPEFRSLMENRAASQGAALPTAVLGDWLEDAGHPELASVFRRHDAWKKRAGRYLPMTPGVKNVFSSGLVYNRVFSRHAISPEEGGGNVTVAYRPWRVGNKMVPGLVFHYQRFNGRSMENHQLMSPVSKEEALTALRRYADHHVGQGNWGHDHTTKDWIEHNGELEEHEQNPEQLAATPTVPGGNSVVVRVPLPTPVGGKPAQPAAPASRPAAPAQQPAAPSARSFILPV